MDIIAKDGIVMFSYFTFTELCTSSEVFASAECRMYMHVSIAPHSWLFSYVIEAGDKNLFLNVKVTGGH
jgi:hypothetical protein